MPTIASRSTIKAEADLYAVSLNVQHRVAVGNPSHASYHTTRLPEDVDILASNLPISISGSFNGCKVSAADVATSCLAQHIVSYFRMNATELRLSTVSDLYLDNNKINKVLLTFSRQYPPVKSEIRPHAQLVALELDFSWKTISSLNSTSKKETRFNVPSHPFSQKLSLPFRSLLDNVIRRCIIWQCVKRYPLIFGPWCQQLDSETSYFPAIFTSILNIVERSSNESFRARCYRLMKMLRHQHMAAFSAASSSLQALASSSRDDSDTLNVTDTERPAFTDEEVFHFAMERLYRDGLRQPPFKGLTCGPTADKADDEELSQAYFCVPATRFDEQLFLDDLPISDAQSPSSLSHWLMDSPLPDDPQSRRTSSLFMDEELDCTDDFHGGNSWGLVSDREQEGQCHMHRSGLALLQMPVDLHEQRDCDIPSAMMDFSDSDNSNDVPFIYQLQKGHRYRNLNTAPQSIPYYAAHDHATSHEDGISQNNSKPSWPGSKDASRSPPDLVLYQDSSSGTSQETEALSPPRRQYICEDMPHRVAEYTTQRPDSCSLFDDSDVLFLSDPESCFNDIETGYEDYCGLEEFEGVHDPEASQHLPTLIITCPHGDYYELEVEEEERASGELKSTLNVDSFLDGAGAQRCGDEWEEDGMVVLDF